MRSGDRKRILAGLSGFIVIAAALILPAGPTTAKPDIADVKKRVDALYHEAEAAQERYHDAKLEYDALKRDLGALRADQRRQDARVEAARGELGRSIARQYVGESIGAVGQVIVSDDPSAFLGRLSTMSAYNDIQTSLYDDYKTELKALNLRRQATDQRVAQATKVESRLAKEQKAVDAKLAEAKSVLSDLEAEERAKLVSRSSSRGTDDAAPLPDVPASGRGGVALRFALAQVGDAYVFGAAGPGAWDCSGLTMVAWAQAGVGLPHSSSAQFGSGPRISSSDLQPGDLVFFYSPISHVGLYAGGGQVVHAARPGEGVKVSPMSEMPYAGAVRPG
ncbi:MAG: NlpC/P60 family protein [Nocardioides sp.]